jgi:hypothetical protein
MPTTLPKLAGTSGTLVSLMAKESTLSRLKELEWSTALRLTTRLIQQHVKPITPLTTTLILEMISQSVVLPPGKSHTLESWPTLLKLILILELLLNSPACLTGNLT